MSSNHHRRRPLARGIAFMLLGCTLLGIIGIGVFLQQFNNTPAVTRHMTEQGARLDPWRPLPGCVTVRDNGGTLRAWVPDATSEIVCGQSKPLLDAAVLGKRSDESGFASVLRAIDTWRAPLQPSPTRVMQRFSSDTGQTIDQGAAIELTLNPENQIRANELLACMTGQLDHCDAIGIDRATWKHHYEQAALRAGALLIMDIATGEIEVAAAAYSKCYRTEHNGENLPQDCPPAAGETRSRDWLLSNGALFASEMPGSLAKLPMMLAILRDPQLGSQIRRTSAAREKFFHDIQHSDTPNFLDRIFCRDQGYACQRLPLVVKAARDLGWNAPAINLVATAQVEPAVALPTPSGRILQTPNRNTNRWQDYDLSYAADGAKKCSERSPQERRWSKCRNEAVANLAAEMWGQGNARISPISVATMLSRIAAAANTRSSIGLPHLVRAVSGEVNGTQQEFKPQARTSTKGIAPVDATLILAAMGLTHQADGTAYTACLKAFGGDATAPLACASLQGMAGKTGTPVFNHDRLTVTQRAAHCATVYQAIATAPSGARHTATLRSEFTQCQMRPIKWYATLLRDDPHSAAGPWTKVMVVLAERNWRLDGHIDSAFDKGTPNIAAEMGFLFIAQGEQHVPSK